MQLSGFMDVAITLVATYVLLSLLCTTLNEFVATLLKIRARTLNRAIKALLDNEAIHRSFLASGLIQSMITSSAGGKGAQLPSYIDSRTFADSLLAALNPDNPLAGFDELKASVDKLSDGSALKSSLLAVLATTQHGATEVRDAIARWFDTSMDRLNGNYVRYMKYLSLAVGFVAAVSLNVDSFRLAEQAWKDPQLRQTALALVQNNTDAAGNLALPECKREAIEEKIGCRTDAIVNAYSGLQQLPLGWEADLPEDGEDPFTWWLLKFFGLLITALAVSVGAPFWFDLLQKVMSLRGAGTKPADTSGAEEGK